MTNLTLDTNVLFYAFDPRDMFKHEVASNILARAYEWRIPLSLQCLSELYNAASRKLTTSSPQVKAKIIDDLRSGLQVVVPDERDVVRAIQIHQREQLQYFDCLLLATVARLGVRTVLSEDMQHNQVINGVRLVNPFWLTPEELAAVLR